MQKVPFLTKTNKLKLNKKRFKLGNWSNQRQIIKIFTQKPIKLVERQNSLLTKKLETCQMSRGLSTIHG